MLARSRDVVAYRDLLRNLVVRDLKVRYRGSFIGFLWSLLNPLLMMGVYWFVFTQLLKSNKAQFHIFVFVALLPWNWCAAAVLGGITSIVGNGHLIKKVYFPRALLPLSVVVSNGINFLLALPVLFVLILLAGTGADLRTIKGHSGPVASVAVAPGGALLASGGDDGTVRLWQNSDGAPLRTLPAGPAVSSVAFAPDGQTVAAASDDHKIHLWRVSDGAVLRTLDVPNSPISSVAFSSDGQTLAAGLRDGSVRLWHGTDFVNWTALPALVSGQAVWNLAFTPDAKILATANDDHKVRLWRLADGQLIGTREGLNAPVVSLGFSRDGATMAAGATDGTVQLWRTGDGRPLRSLIGNKTTVYSLAFDSSPVGNLLVTAGDDHVVRLWRVSDGTLLRAFAGHSAKVNSVAFAPDGFHADTLIVSGSDDGQVRQWVTAGATHMQLSPNILWLPALIAIEAIFLTGVALFGAALNVFFRDTQAIMEVGITAWFFLTPIIYDAHEVVSRDLEGWMYRLNPMASLISNFRIILYNDGMDPTATGPDPTALLGTLITSLVVLALGYGFFRSLSRRFGEEL